MKQEIQRIEKMKRLSLLCFLALVITGIWAEVYTIGNGTESSNQAPVNVNANFSWSKMIYPATDIINSGVVSATSIIGIGYQIQNPVSDHTLTNQHVYLKLTSETNYTDFNLDTNNFTEVFAGSVTYQGNGWQQLTFSQPFTWDGSSNLEIVWTNHHGSSKLQYPKFYRWSTSSNTLVYKSGSTFSYGPGTPAYKLPNLQLITPMSPEPAVTVYPGDGGYALSGSRLIWKSGGGCPTSYSVHFGTVDPPPLISPGQTYPWYQPELEAGETYYWQIVPSNAYGTVSLPPVWSFRVPELGQLCENFENELPPGWLNPGSWDFPPDQYYPYHGTKCAQVRAGAAGNLLATPKLQLTSESTLEFMALSNAAPGSAGFRVKRSSDGTNWNEVAILPAISAANVWQRFELDLGSLAGQSYHLGIEAYNAGSGSNPLVFLDHVVGPRPVGVYPSPEVSISRRDNGFRLSWESPGGVTGYRVLAADDVDSFGEEALAELSASQTFFDVPTGNRKFFRVTAIY